jgi:hypothetical protein
VVAVGGVGQQVNYCTVYIGELRGQCILCTGVGIYCEAVSCQIELLAMADFAAVETTPVVNEAPVVTPTGPSQLFRVFSINGSVSLVRLSVAGGCNIHARISEHMNAEINAAETRPAERRERKFQVVFGNAPIEELYNLVFAPGAKDAPGWDELFDEYYFETFVMAKEHNRDLWGKEFSEIAFSQAPPEMHLHVTLALSAPTISGQTQMFHIHEMTGRTREVSLPVTGGLNVHERISAYLNEQMNSESPSQAPQERKFKIVLGSTQILDLYTQLFAPGTSDNSATFDNLYEAYYSQAFLAAQQQGRDLLGRVFSETAFAQSQQVIHLFVTISLRN